MDVQYSGEHARAAGLVFSGWDSETIIEEVIVEIDEIGDYLPGEFYRRELPCLLRVLSCVSASIDVILIDGYVWLDEQQKPGLGAKLFESLGQRIPVVGIAKTRYRGAPGNEILRGQSQQPLMITTVGMPTEDAAENVKGMHGMFRIPTQIRRVDQIARGNISSGLAAEKGKR